jgi:hypothetical protein
MALNKRRDTIISLDATFDGLRCRDIDNRNRLAFKQKVFPSSLVYSHRKNSYEYNYTNFVHDNSIFVTTNNLRRNSFLMEEKEFFEIFQSSFKYLNAQEAEPLEDNDVRSVFLLEDSSPSNRKSSFGDINNDLGVVEQFMD